LCTEDGTKPCLKSNQFQILCENEFRTKILKLRKKPILRSDQKLPRKPRKFEKLKLRPKRLFLKSRIKQQQLTTTLNPKTQLNPTHPDKAKL